APVAAALSLRSGSHASPVMVRRSSSSLPLRCTKLRFPTSNRARPSSGQQGLHQGVGQPVLVFLRRPPALANQHPVHLPASKHPEDIPGGPVIKSRSKSSRVA